jgi:hypothetical protein
MQLELNQWPNEVIVTNAFGKVYVKYSLEYIGNKTCYMAMGPELQLLGSAAVVPIPIPSHLTIDELWDSMNSFCMGVEKVRDHLIKLSQYRLLGDNLPGHLTRVFTGRPVPELQALKPLAVYAIYDEVYAYAYPEPGTFWLNQKDPRPNHSWTHSFDPYADE